MHGTLEERDAVRGLGPEPLPGALDHTGGEVQGDDPFEPLDQVGQKRPGAAAEVRHGLATGIGYGVESPARADSRRPAGTGRGRPRHTAPHAGSSAGPGFEARSGSRSRPNLARPVPLTLVPTPCNARLGSPKFPSSIGQSEESGQVNGRFDP